MTRKTYRPFLSTVLAIGLAIPIAAATSLAPAHAIGLTVFDPSNYAQNLLTAARTLEQIRNQIKSLQNEATMLSNMARNLARLDFPELQQLKARIDRIDQLMRQANGIDFRLDRLDAQFRRLYPQVFDAALTNNTHVIDARARLDAAMAAFRQTMSVQARIAESIGEDAETLTDIIGKSQGAEGALQAQQATNQLLALAAKQQMQIQSLMASQYRAEAGEQARRVQAESDAHAATLKFLGSGRAYTPN